MRIRIPQKFSSHLPLLIEAVYDTEGDVLEMGMGLYSTPVLHWMLFTDPRRKLVSLESDKRFVDMLGGFRSQNHEIRHVTDWDSEPIERPWSVVFIDHDENRRSIDAIRVANYAMLVVLHDTCHATEKKYGYEKVYPHYKYQFKFEGVRPKTTVLSNLIPVSEYLSIWN